MLIPESLRYQLVHWIQLFEAIVVRFLRQKDFERILTEPEFNMLQQQAALLATEGIALDFEPDAISEIARLAEEINHSVDNIGARRLHTVLERILEEISFEAPEEVPPVLHISDPMLQSLDLYARL